MLFTALLLIEWVTLTIGATASPFPRKEIHLQTPVESHVKEVDSAASPFALRYLKEASVARFRHSSLIQTDIKRVASTENLPANSAGHESRSKREVLNSLTVSKLLLSKRHFPSTSSLNLPFPESFEKMNKFSHILTPRYLRDLSRGKRDSNFSLPESYPDIHYTQSFDKKQDLSTNISLPYSPLPESSEKSFKHRKNSAENGSTVPSSEASLVDGITKVNNSAPLEKFSHKENSTREESHNKSGTTLSTPVLQKQKNEAVDIEVVDKEEANETESAQTSQTLNTNIKQQVKKGHQHFLNGTQQAKVTRKPKSKTRANRKQKVLLNSTNSDLLFNKVLNVSLKGNSQVPMLQDGTYQTITSATTLFSEKSWFRNDREKGNHKSDTFRKSSTMAAFYPSTITTPDSHMNDPPFRGPNIPPDIEKLYGEKDKTKISYHNPQVVESSFYSVKNLAEDWKPSMHVKGIAWACHFYIIGSIFGVLALYSFISLLRVNTFITLLSTGYYIAVNSIIFLLCLLRSLYLFYDPYNLQGSYPILAASIFSKITLPCLTSSFLLLQLSFLNSTKTQFLTPKFQRPCILALLITICFLTFFSAEIAVWAFQAPSILIVASQLFLIVWAKISCISYFCVFKRLHHRALRKQGEMIRLTFTKMHIDGAQLPKKLPKPALGLAVKLVLISAILQTLLCILIPFGMVIFHVILPTILLKDPWVWWWYQLICRIFELLIITTISFVATQPEKHFEIGNNRFCSILMWFPCSSFTECFKKDEIVDFEAHSDNYANPQGLRSTGFNLSANARRLQTNSLPTFRTPLTEVDKNLPMRTLPCSGRHNNHASAISLLSYYRSKRTLSLSTHEGLEDLERTLCNQTTLSSDGRNNTIRPASMLFKDNGFIRFRRENDPEQPMEMSDEDDRTQDEADTSLEDAESTRANVGSSFHSLLEGDIVQNTLSPFFQIGYKRRFRKMSRISIETTDYSADVSSDQLSNVVNLRNGLSSSALDFNTRKYGSTCSSESAANSFDVTFFLNSNSSPEMQTSPTSITPVSLNVCSAYRSETEDDKTSSVEGHEVMLRSVSPIVKRASSGRLSLNLSLHTATDVNHSNGHVNVACGTEDITPDSAVYLDLQLSKENTMSPKLSSKKFPLNLDIPSKGSMSDSFTKSTDGILPISPDRTSTKQSPTISPTSQSLCELRTSNSYVVIPRIRKTSKGLFFKLRGSTFSLNAAINGYERLELEEHSKNPLDQNSRKRLQRSSSDGRPLSEGQLEVSPQMTPLGDFRARTTGTGSGYLGDSGLLGDCDVALVDVASQTEESEMNDTHKTCTLLTKPSLSSNSQAHICTPLVDIRK